MISYTICSINQTASVIAIQDSKKGGVNRSQQLKGWKKEYTNAYNAERWGDDARCKCKCE